MKKIISTFLIISIFFWNIAFLYAEDSCKYTSQIEECREANKSWSPLAIKDFLCVSEIDEEKMIYNIILDDKFKEIDKEADLYLDSLENDKTRFFWPDQREPFLRWVDEIYEAFWKNKWFYNAYKAQLVDVRAETVACLPKSKTSIDEIENYFLNSGLLDSMINDKNSTRLKVANDILALNNQQVRKDSSKKFMQIRRTMYDSVANLFMINLGYLMRIMFKWPSKTKNPY